MSDERPLPNLYRVVGVRSDRSNIILGTGLVRDEAQRIMDAMVSANVFALVHLQLDTPILDDPEATTPMA